MFEFLKKRQTELHLDPQQFKNLLDTIQESIEDTVTRQDDRIRKRLERLYEDKPRTTVDTLKNENRKMVAGMPFYPDNHQEE